MQSEIAINDKLLADGWIGAEAHARLIVRRGEVYDDSEAAFDLTEAGDVKLRDSLVWLKGYALD